MAEVLISQHWVLPKLMRLEMSTFRTLGVVLLVLAVSLIFHKMQRDWSFAEPLQRGLEPKLKAENYIEQEGSIHKFVQRAGQVSSCRTSTNEGARCYLCNRTCSLSSYRFRPSACEIAPGIDVQKQILDLMDFTPRSKKP